MRNVFMSLLLIGSLNSKAFADDAKLISVVGSAEKSFQPDIAHITVSIWGKGTSAKKAQEINQKYYGVFEKSLAKFGVKNEDVQTANYSLNPDYTYNEKTKKNIVTSYEANQNIVVKLKNIKEVGQFIDSLSDNQNVQDGGINLNALNFDISKRTEEEKALLGKAVEDAAKTADILAQTAKVKIKKVYRISPISQNAPVENFGRMRNKMAMMDVAASSTSVLAGEVKVASQVMVEYEIN